MKIFGVVIAVVFALSACVKDPITGKSTYNWYSLSTDIKLGQQVMASQLKSLHQANKKMDAVADPAMSKKIQLIADDIAKVSHIPKFPWEVHLADVDVVNAWCAPGGKIMVYSGLYDAKKGLVDVNKTDELAAVMAHEITHATARHVTESLSRQQSAVLVGQVALSAIASAGSQVTTDMFQQVITGGLNIYLPAYSRKNESEADRIGLFYMAAAGYNPQAAVDVWYRACKKRGDKTSIFASHPSSCQRAKDLEKLMPKAQELYLQVKAGKKVRVPPKIY
jgi:metalloendopeptidase OMA1, mitochondrial